MEKLTIGSQCDMKNIQLQMCLDFFYNFNELRGEIFFLKTQLSIRSAYEELFEVDGQGKHKGSVNDTLYLYSAITFHMCTNQVFLNKCFPDLLTWSHSDYMKLQAVHSCRRTSGALLQRKNISDICYQLDIQEYQKIQETKGAILR